MRLARTFIPSLVLASCASTNPGAGSEAVVRAIDERQRALVAAGDYAGLAELADPSLRINAPAGRALTREVFLANVRSGEIAAERFERTVEAISISGVTALVMGREIFTPFATSELGRIHGSQPLQRRFTNIYVWRQGKWYWLGRQANIVTVPGMR